MEARGLSDADRDFVIAMAKQAEDREQWLSIMRFGLGTLVKNPPLMQTLLFKRAADEVVHESRYPDQKGVAVPPEAIPIVEVRVFELLDLLGLCMTFEPRSERRWTEPPDPEPHILG